MHNVVPMPEPAQILVRINADLQWKATIGKGGNYVAVCDPLKITLQAETWAELMEDAAEVLDAIFRDLLSSNELERFLQERGWTTMGQVPNRQDNVRFDVPFFFLPLMAQLNDPQNYARQ